MEWEDRIQEIQDKYFRSGPYTRLDIDYCKKKNRLRWKFSCMDFGMCHVISGHAIVVGEESFSVNGRSNLSREQAWEAVFSGHYAAFMRDFFRDIGFEALVS